MAEAGASGMERTGTAAIAQSLRARAGRAYPARVAAPTKA